MSCLFVDLLSGLDVFAEISEFERFMADKPEESYQLITRDVQEQLDAEAARLAAKRHLTAAAAPAADGTLFSGSFAQELWEKRLHL